MKKVLHKLYNLGVNTKHTSINIARQRNINLICWTVIAACLLILIINIPTGEKFRIYPLIVVLSSLFS